MLTAVEQGGGALGQGGETGRAALALLQSVLAVVVPADAALGGSVANAAVGALHNLAAVAGLGEALVKQAATAAAASTHTQSASKSVAAGMPGSMCSSSRSQQAAAMHACYLCLRLCPVEEGC